MQAAAGDADLPDEAALLDQVSAAMKAILNSTIKRPQIPAVCHVDGTGRPDPAVLRTHRRADAAQHLRWPPADVVDNANEPIVCTLRQAKPAPSAHQARRPIGSKRAPPRFLRSVIPRMPLQYKRTIL